MEKEGRGTFCCPLLPLKSSTCTFAFQSCIALAGDPQQLGPVVRSAVAATAVAATGTTTAAAAGPSSSSEGLRHETATAVARGGGSSSSTLPDLSTSLLDICIDYHNQQQEQQQEGNEGEDQGVHLEYGMLVRNYRSHSRLLDLPSRLFYGGMLQPCAPAAAVAAPAWAELKGEEKDTSVTPPAAAAAGKGGVRVKLEEGAEDTANSTEAGGGGGGVGIKLEEGVEDTRSSTAGAAAGGRGVGGGGMKIKLEEGVDPTEAGVAREGEGEWEGAEDAAGEEEAEDELLGLLPTNTLFVGVRGKQHQEGDAPSYFNPLEATVVVDLVVSLLGTGSVGGRAAVTVNDIGVMATYRRQVSEGGGGVGVGEQEGGVGTLGSCEEDQKPDSGQEGVWEQVAVNVIVDRLLCRPQGGWSVYSLKGCMQFGGCVKIDVLLLGLPADG